MNESLQEAIAVARAGHRAAAVKLLRLLVQQEPRNEEAWLWLGGISSDPEEQLRALQTAAEIDPQDRRAKDGIEMLRRDHPDLVNRTEVSGRPFGAATYDAAPARPLGGPFATLALPPEGSEIDMPPLEPARESIAQPVAEVPAIHNAPTVAQPVVQPEAAETRDTALTRPMVAARPGNRPLETTTQEMPAVVVPQRNLLAMTARWVLALIWMAITLVLGTATALAARIALQPGGQQLPNTALNMLGAMGVSTNQQMFQYAAGTLAVMTLIGFIVTVGLFFRWRSAHWLNLLFSVLAAVVAVLIGVIAWSNRGDISGIDGMVGVSPQIGGTIAALILVWPLVLALIAWPEFRRRPKVA
ncbi:MAG: hypothetical protein NVS2B7_30310 [Herpetosiphon sp.]